MVTPKPPLSAAPLAGPTQGPLDSVPHAHQTAAAVGNEDCALPWPCRRTVTNRRRLTDTMTQVHTGEDTLSVYVEVISRAGTPYTDVEVVSRVPQICDRIPPARAMCQTSSTSTPELSRSHRCLRRFNRPFPDYGVAPWSV